MDKIRCNNCNELFQPKTKLMKMCSVCNSKYVEFLNGKLRERIEKAQGIYNSFAEGLTKELNS